ncbi:hypothetical protein ABZW11_07570 [Nonomuraea sp. NPDC004580]|uniref:hypothetical protein n=1 Tax=Nonomuraea sp. NPDC004580 TaxID=3154552 RepID=UPI0033AA301D
MDERFAARVMISAPGRGEDMNGPAEHRLGGISTFHAAETTDENPDRVAAVRALIWAYLRSELYPGDPAWTLATEALPLALQMFTGLYLFAAPYAARRRSPREA